jgi:hypothetical protein
MVVLEFLLLFRRVRGCFFKCGWFRRLTLRL